MSARRRRKRVRLAKTLLISSLAILIFIFFVGEVSVVITKTQQPSNASLNGLRSGSPSNATAPSGESRSGSEGGSTGSVTVLPRGGGP
jgi:hypothetical protein